MSSDLAKLSDAERRSPAMFDRLAFTLPPFVRVSWTSDRMQAIWDSRIRRVAEACLAVEEESVLAGLRACGLVTLTSMVVDSKVLSWIRSGFVGAPIDSYPRAEVSSDPQGAVHRYLVGTSSDVVRCQEAIERGDDSTAASLLGYPPCCAEFASDTAVEWGMEDQTWPYALNSLDGKPTGNLIELSGEFVTNPFWRSLGVRILPHFPCRLGCAESIELGNTLLDTARSIGYVEEAKWLTEILSWPVQWSALHGIAEIETPVLKVSTPTDATGAKYTARLSGSAYPEQAVPGNAFPYIPPAKKLTQSRGFQLGLINADSLVRSDERPNHELRQIRLIDAVYEGLIEAGRSRAANLNISGLCTGGYCTTVELSDGSQGVATNFLNVQGPHARHYEHSLYDGVLSEYASTDRLLEELIVRPGYMDPLAQSVKVAIANALSEPLFSPEKLRTHGFQVNDGLLSLDSLLEPGDEVTLIDCAGSWVCRSVASCLGDSGRVNFCDLGWGSPFRPEVQDFFEGIFGEQPHAKIVEESNKEAACRDATVVVVAADAICTDSLDEILDWSQDAREMVVVGRSYAMDPRPLFDRGATALSTYRIARSGLVDLVRQYHAAGSNENEIESWFVSTHVTRAAETARRPPQGT